MNGKLEQILYSYYVLSWSWMTYSEGIELLDVPLGEVEWVNHLKLDEGCDHALIMSFAKAEALGGNIISGT